MTSQPARLVLGLVLSLAPFLHVSATTADSPWSLQVWHAEEGLPNNNVAALAQADDGYLWLATPTSLARFDGNRFEEFRPASFAPAYQNRRIRSMTKRRHGGFYVWADPGHLILLANGSTRILTNGLPVQSMASMVEDNNGALWISYHNGDVFRILDGKALPFGARENFPRGTSSCVLARDSDGTIWFVKGSGVGLFRDGEFKHVLRLPRAGARITGSSSGGIWACVDFQLYRINEHSVPDDRGRIRDGTIRGPITVMMEDQGGGVWIGTSAAGLFHYDGKQFENVPTSDREILSLTQDREGNVWVGTGGGGLNRLRPRPITLANLETGAPFQAAQSLCEDVRGVIWATTQDGSLVSCSNGVWKTIAHPEFASAMATSVTTDPEGNVWVGTSARKLIRWRDGKATTWTPADGLIGRVIHGLHFSRAGDLWISQEQPDALQRLRQDKLQTFELPPSAHHLRSFAEDDAGNVWVAGDRGVLVRIAGDKVTDESAVTAELPKLIRCLRASADGSLWIGYGAGGIVRVKDGKFRRITAAQGLHVESINQMVADGCGSVWIGTDRGIFRIPEPELNAVADGRAEELRFIHYGRSEGLPGFQARYGDWPGALRTREGRVLIPMRTALAIVHPEKLREDLKPPPVLVNRVSVDDQTTALYGGGMPTGTANDLNQAGARLELPPSHRRLQFEFTALSFGPPENIRFRYRLDGFDETWREAGSERHATYSRLAAGGYRFLVKGCNSDGIWNEQEAALAFVVRPFLWQTWWFRFAALAIFTVCVVAIVRYVSFRRLRFKLQALEQQAALDKERARIARDIHDDLGGSLTQVALLSRLALRDWSTPEKAGEHVQQISRTSREVIKSLDEIVWAVNPRNDTLTDLVNYIGQFAVEFLRTANIRCRVKLPDHPPARGVSSEIRHSLFLALKEALNNVVRHAQASEVLLRITTDSDLVTITIEDNGRGFDQAPDDPSADGLRNMRQRMEEMGGQFHIASIPGKGTRISLMYSLPQTK